MTLPQRFSLLGLVTACVLMGFAPVQDKDNEEGFVVIFNGKDLTGFKTAGNKKNKDESFTVEDGAIKVTLNGGGSYVHTEKSYKNYILRFDWKFPNRAGYNGNNSGCFVHMTPDGRGGIEVQGWEYGHGGILARDATIDEEAQKKVIKIGEWNSTEIISQDGQLTAKVNGTQVSTAKVNRTEGQIGFQREGAEVLFKNIRIKELP